MRLDTRGTRGSVAVELAILLPILLFLVIGGWVLGYIAYTKVALAMVANRAARDLAAATDLYANLEKTDVAYRYDLGFAESFGLPRWGIHALAKKGSLRSGDGLSDHAVVVGVCYRVPFALPFGVLEKPEPPPRLPNTSVIEDAVHLSAEVVDAAEMERYVRDYQRERPVVEREIAAWYRLVQRAERLVGQGEDIWSKGEWVYGLGKELVKGSPKDFTPYRSGVTLAQLEKTAAELCASPDAVKDESVVMTSRAAYLMQEVFKPQSPGAAESTGTRKKGVSR